MTVAGVIYGLFDFAFYYPVFMSYVWMAGAIYYFFYREQTEHRRLKGRAATASPRVPVIT